MKTNSDLVLQLTPLEAERLVEYINNHKGEYIELYHNLGLGIRYAIEVSTEETEKVLNITDFDSF